MSTEIQLEPVACPKCDALLLPERLNDVAVLCANCRAAFVPAGRCTIPRTSGRAKASLALGLLSLVGLFVTGIPAIWLGCLAYRDIQRAPKALKGKGFAICGIASGTVFGLMCGTCLGLGFTFWLAGQDSMIHAQDPVAVAEIAASVAVFEPPRGTDPLEAIEMRMIGVRTVIYGREPLHDHPLIVLIQYPQGSLRPQVEGQFRETIDRKTGRNDGSLETVESAQLEFTIGGQSVPVSRTLRRDPGRGDRLREYVAEIPIPGRLTLAALVTPDEAAPGTDGVALSEDEVRDFFESFRQ